MSVRYQQYHFFVDFVDICIVFTINRGIITTEQSGISEMQGL